MPRAQDVVDASSISYFSSIEKNLISQYIETGETDYLGLFLAVDPDVTLNELEEARIRYKTAIEEFNLDKLNKKKAQVKVQRIYRNIHNSFFQLYREKNYFSHVFQKGEYNCVSATAFYGMVFESLDIPFTIRENPTHVYLVAYPETDKILVETTAPGVGFNLYSETFKRTFIQKLAENKIISGMEYEGEDVNTLFDKYYFNDEDIDLTRLVGLQYMNDAIYKLEKDELNKAYSQLEKAYLFYPGEKLRYMLLMTGVQLLNRGDYYDDETVDMYVRLTRFEGQGIDRDMILGEFGKIKEEILVRKNDPERFAEVHNVIHERIESQELKNEIAFIFHVENGRVLFNMGQYRKGLDFLEEAARLKPENLNANGLLVTSILHIASNEPDPGKRIEFLDEYRNRYATLEANGHFMTMLAESYLGESSRRFITSNPSKGLEWLEKFEKLTESTTEMNTSYNLLGEAYSTAAVYYFRRGNKSKARELLKRGLRYSPGNFELEQRLRVLR